MQHLLALREVRTVSSVRLWGRTPEHVASMAVAMRTALLPATTPVVICIDVEDAVHDADVICTLTGATLPILQGSWLKRGCHVNAVGACTPGHRELATSVLVGSRVFVDTMDACLREPGDIVVPLKSGEIQSSLLLGEIGAVLAGTIQGRVSVDDVTVFKSVGIALEDLVATAAVHEAAMRRSQRSWKEVEVTEEEPEEEEPEEEEQEEEQEEEKRNEKKKKKKKKRKKKNTTHRKMTELDVERHDLNNLQKLFGARGYSFTDEHLRKQLSTSKGAALALKLRTLNMSELDAFSKGKKEEVDAEHDDGEVVDDVNGVRELLSKGGVMLNDSQLGEVMETDLGRAMVLQHRELRSITKKLEKL